MYPFFTVFIIFALFTMIKMKRSANNYSIEKEKFLEREREANNVRKRPLTDLDYIVINLSDLPYIETEDEFLIERINTLFYLAEEDTKIVNLSAYTNTDLKLKYGVANLTILTEYDQNFTNLCRCLFEIGKRLYDSGDISNAKAFLEYGIKCKTDLKSHYALLADIYEQNLEYKKIVDLIKCAENINSALKEATIRDLKNRLNDTNFSADEPTEELEDLTV